MNRSVSSLPARSALALCILSVFLLPACSSSGGSQTDQPEPLPQPTPRPPPPPPSPPPAQPRTLQLPPAPPAKPIPAAPALDASSGDIVKLVAFGSTTELAATSSGGSLTKQGKGELGLYNQSYRFDGGTHLDEGSTTLFGGTLFSDVTIAAGASFHMRGDVVGDVDNRGYFDPTDEPGWYEAFYDGDIFGDYRQSSGAKLHVWLGLEDTKAATPLLNITGTATLGGALEVQPYYTTQSGYLEWIIHAGGGVFGQFDRWGTPSGTPYFITGELHYTANDVYLLTSRISLTAAVANAAVGDSFTLSTAGVIDAAFNQADTFAALPAAALSQAQHQLLSSAASIQQLADYDQVVTAFDSLSGHGQIAAVDALLQQALTSASQASARLGSLPPGARSGPWTGPLAIVPTGAGAFTNTQMTGFDQWVGDGLVIGSSFGWTQGNLQFDRSGGTGYSQSSQWNVYLRREGIGDSYLIGDVGYSRQQLDLDRPIELGGRRMRARSERNLDASHAYLESGRRFRLGRGYLTSFAALGYAAMRGDPFTEQGSSGFELTTQASYHERIGSDVGLRYERSWHWLDDRWLRLGLGSRFQHLLGASDDLRAAFTGAPAVEFQVGGPPRERDATWLEVNLAGGAGPRWSWLLNYDNRASDETVSLGFQIQL